MTGGVPLRAMAGAAVLALLGVAALTTALDVRSWGTPALIAWSVAMAGPLILAPVLTAFGVHRWQDQQAGVRALAALEAEVGPLVGRTGRVQHHRGDREHGGGAARFVDEHHPSLLVFVLPPAPPSGARVRVATARPLRPGEIPFVACGVGVTVAPLDG